MPESHGLSSDVCRRSVWVVDEYGNAWSGAKAVAAALDAALDTDLGVRLFRIPLIGNLAEIGYGLVARIRHRLPGKVPYCVSHPDVCGGSGRV
jgi:predicted DCC family thiol-disulfide oxidoreductase YuxK